MQISTVQFSNLSLRTRTALVLIAALFVVYLIAAAMPGGHWLLAVVALTFVLGAAWEFGQVTSVLQSGNLANARRFLYSAIVGLAPLVLFALAIDSSGACPDNGGCLKLGSELGLSVFLAFLLAVLYAALEGRTGLEGTQSVFRDLAIGVLQIGWGGAAIVGLALFPRGEWILLWLMLVVFSNDIAAYFVGSHFQGPKLAPMISPNKTISGAIGALIVGSLVGSISHKLLGVDISAFGVVLLTAGVIIAAQLGDLLKSLLKRLYGVKDTGHLLPGHGGVLDRIDGLLFAAPLLYLVLTL